MSHAPSLQTYWFFSLSHMCLSRTVSQQSQVQLFSHQHTCSLQAVCKWGRKCLSAPDTKAWKGCRTVHVYQWVRWSQTHPLWVCSFTHQHIENAKFFCSLQHSQQSWFLGAENRLMLVAADAFAHSSQLSGLPTESRWPGRNSSDSLQIR